jgi:hypothetical protein
MHSVCALLCGFAMRIVCVLMLTIKTLEDDPLRSRREAKQEEKNKSEKSQKPSHMVYGHF